MWEGNKSQAGSLESIILDGAKRILGCSSKTCNEAVRGDMGLDTLQSRRDRAMLKWWYKLATLPEDRYPKQLFNQKWNIKPRRGRQRKVQGRRSRVGRVGHGPPNSQASRGPGGPWPTQLSGQGFFPAALSRHRASRAPSRSTLAPVLMFGS